MKSIIACALMLAVNVGAADAGFSVTRYGNSDLVALKTKLRFTTVIEFPPKEEIAEVSCGDTAFWIIDGKDNVLNVKPAKEGVSTNLNVVLRSKAVYSFVIAEVGTDGAPDLRVVVGPDEVTRLREENRALQKLLDDLNSAQKKVTAELEESKKREKVSAGELQKADEKHLLVRPALPVNQKTDEPWAYSTSSYTMIIGSFNNTPSFEGYDGGKLYRSIPFEHQGNWYKLSRRIQHGTIHDGSRRIDFTTK